MGRLGDDPAGAEGEWTEGTAGGFAEAAGGVVYELGDAARVVPVEGPTVVTPGGSEGENALGAGVRGVVSMLGETLGAVRTRATVGEQRGKAVTSNGTLAIITALVASSVVSLCIGFDAGRGAALSAPTPIVSQRTAIVVRTIPAVVRTSDGGSRMVVAEPTVSELRARQESRVLREKRAIENVGRRLEIDEGRLKDLVRQEAEILEGGGATVLPQSSSTGI